MEIQKVGNRWWGRGQIRKAAREGELGQGPGTHGPTGWGGSPCKTQTRMNQKVECIEIKERRGRGKGTGTVGREGSGSVGGASLEQVCAEAWRKLGRSLGMTGGRASKLDLLLAFGSRVRKAEMNLGSPCRLLK